MKNIMKKVIKLAFVAAFVAVAGYGVYANQTSDAMSDLALANVEALAMDEYPDPIDPNKAYGYQLQNCYDTSKPPRVIGATCVQVEDREAGCLYSSCWGKC